ncbi:MAG TPA: DUF6339 family protein [Solirubrobacterales bacterium]
MPELIRRYSKPLSAAGLTAALKGDEQPAEALATSVPLDDVSAAIESVGECAGSEIDGKLVEPLHRAIPLTLREAADMRVWHWLTVRFQGTVWQRWPSYHKQWQETEELTGEAVSRFLGRSSLNGVSRNTLARLWWAGEQMSDGDDYSLARDAIDNQDRFQAIFERRYGLYPPAAKACLKSFRGLSEGEVRDAARWLQQCLSTTVLEHLSEVEISALLEERPAA